MLTEGLYRDKDGQTAHVSLTVTGYLIRYTDGRTVILSNHPGPVPQALIRPEHQQPHDGRR